MDKYIFHITPYDFIFIGTIFTGLIFALLLIFTKRSDRVANCFLGLALGIVVFWTTGLLAIDIQHDTYFISREWPPLYFSLALGPLLYFFALLKTKPDRAFCRKDLLHFSPLLLELASLFSQVKQLTPVLLSLAFISVTAYVYCSYILVKDFRRWLKFNADEQDKHQLRWLQNMLKVFGIVWLMWLPYITANYLFYHQPLIHFYYPLYIVLITILMAMGAAAVLKPQLRMPAPGFSGLPPGTAQKGDWLRKAIETRQLYQDPDLSLISLGEAVGLHPRELSRIINLAIGKNFNDLINEYRILDIKRKMQDPAYNHITLLGIAQSAGFNSKTTFNRAFKQMTGKSAAEYKNDLKKVRPNHEPRPQPHFAPVISHQQTTPKWYAEKLNRNFMFKNYLKITWRNMVKNKAYTALNISGLAAGMAVALLIGLWMWDELSFDKYHKNYDHIAQVLQNRTFNGDVATGKAVPALTGDELRKNYGGDFKYTVMSSWSWNHTLTAGEKKISRAGCFMEQDAPKLLSLNIIKGTGDGLADPSSILISQSIARALFGDANPVDQLLRFDNQKNFRVIGVYEDLPRNTSLYQKELSFIAPWSYYKLSDIRDRANDWSNNSFQLFVQVTDNADMALVSRKIKNLKLDRVSKEDAKYKPQMFLHPMSKWHLYSEFKNGVVSGGKIQYVWLFGIIGVFVLLLACINFMNLSTAQSEKRAKEVGIRKAVGSLRTQLIMQFFCESLSIAVLAFGFAIVIVMLVLPVFNSIADKNISITWANPMFWLLALGFTILTGVLAGSYPALYLSSFQPVKVLKGAFKAGRFAALPRKVLVVVQFAVSVVLIIGTIIVFKQIQYAKSRPVGYSRDGLVTIPLETDDLHKQFAVVRNELIQSGAAAEVAESSSPVTHIDNNVGGINWRGKDPAMSDDFGMIGVTPEYGKAMHWEFTDGRDFTREFLTDSTGLILNEAAVKYMGFKKPIDEVVRFMGADFRVIGVIKNMIMESPYEPAQQTIYYMHKGLGGYLNVRLNPKISAHDAMARVESICKTYSPSAPFRYSFADDAYAKKFIDEVRIGRLSSYFAVLAIVISCLGLFGMASFMAEQRIKEIGVRKVLGASVFSLWRLMSVDFVMLIVISLLIATPAAYYFMHNWLQKYTYRAGLSWWVFAVTGGGAIVITLLTISYQSIKAALTNPVKSLKSE